MTLHHRWTGATLEKAQSILSEQRNKAGEERDRQNNFSTVSGLGRTRSDSLEMEKKSGGSFVVEQRATQSLCVWYSLFPLFFRKEGWDESDGRERKTETVKGGTSSYRMKRKKRESERE